MAAVFYFMTLHTVGHKKRALPLNFCPCIHWRRQLRGTRARAPLDFQLVILGITRFTAHGFLSSRAFSGHRFCRLSLDCGKCTKTTRFLRNFYQCLAHFCHFCPQFSSGSNYSFQNAGTIANKFQLHTYFRFR